MVSPDELSDLVFNLGDVFFALSTKDEDIDGLHAILMFRAGLSFKLTPETIPAHLLPLLKAADDLIRATYPGLQLFEDKS